MAKWGIQNPEAYKYDPNDVRWHDATIAIRLPPGLIVIDVDYTPGTDKCMTTHKIDEYLGVELPWDEAFLQTTSSGDGKHYAFRISDDMLIPTRSDIAKTDIGRGFDIRAPNTGIIYTGMSKINKEGVEGNYYGKGNGNHAGVLLLTSMLRDGLPELPRIAYDKLGGGDTAIISNTPTSPEYSDIWLDEDILELLQYHDGDSRDSWLRVFFALKHHYANDPEKGIEIFNSFSQVGEFNPSITDTANKWFNDSNSCTSPITIGTLIREAQESTNGAYTRPSRKESTPEEIFGAPGEAISAPLPIPKAKTNNHIEPNTLTFEQLVVQIDELGANVNEWQNLMYIIGTSKCDNTRTTMLVNKLHKRMKDSDEGECCLTAKQIQKQVARANATLTIVVEPQSVDPLCTMDELINKVAPIPGLGNIDGQNTDMLLQSVFKDRLAILQGQICWWNGMWWENVTEAQLHRVVSMTLRGSQYHSSKNIACTTKVLLTCLATDPEISPVSTRIFFRNGVLDPTNTSVGVVPHDKRNRNGCVINVNYDDQAKCPLFVEWLNDIFQTDMDRIILLQEILGWWLITDNLDIQKCIAFDGVSRAGKGTLIRIVESLLGDSVQPVSLGQLANDKILSTMRPANLAIDSDCTVGKNSDCARMKTNFRKIASNEAISVPLLYQQTAWRGKLNCKYAIASNGIPTFADESGATMGRWFVLKFDRSFNGVEDTTLLNRLLNELDGIAIWAIQGLNRLMLNKRFTQPESSMNAHMALSDSSGHLTAFIEDTMKVSTDDRVHIHTIVQLYDTWCDRRKIKESSRYEQFKLPRALESAFGSCGTNALYKQLKINGVNKQGFKGIRLRDNSPQPLTFDTDQSKL